MPHLFVNQCPRIRKKHSITILIVVAEREVQLSTIHVLRRSREAAQHMKTFIDSSVRCALDYFGF